MTITFEIENDIIIYAIEKIISHTRRTQKIFVAECVWWLASIIRFEERLVSYIDNLQSWVKIMIAPAPLLDTSVKAPTDISEVR
jgi:hypothetical protein